MSLPHAQLSNNKASVETTLEESMPFIYLFEKNTSAEFITKVIEQRTTTNKIRTKTEVTGRMKQTA